MKARRPGARVAVFDNDGTLWVEQPMYTQLAFGNFDGDLQMLKWTTAGAGKRLGLILRHDDPEREYAYDRESHFGKLDKAVDAAGSEGGKVVSVKSDWNQVFPPTAAVR